MEVAKEKAAWIVYYPPAMGNRGIAEEILEQLGYDSTVSDKVISKIKELNKRDGKHQWQIKRILLEG